MGLGRLQKLVGHLHDLILLQAQHLGQESPHVGGRLAVDLDLLMDVVALQECALHVHGADAPSFAACHQDQQVHSNSRDRRRFRVQLA